MDGKRRALGRTWTPPAQPLVEALSAYLDALAERWPCVECQQEPPGAPVSSGIVALDQLLDGGFGRGRPTVLETSSPGPAQAMLYNVARFSAARILIATSDPHRTCQGLVAADASVAACFLDDGLLTDADWDEVADALPRLAQLDVRICGSATAEIDGALAAEPHVELVLLDEETAVSSPTRVEALGRVAAARDVALVVVASPLGELPSWRSGGMNQIAFSSVGGGTQITLVRVDDFAMLKTVDLAVDPLTGALCL